VEDEFAYGMEILKGFAEKAKTLKREEVSLSELCIGLKCGGSDGYSGLTANPLVGRISDKIISAGGSAVLTEVPEMFGAEQILMNQCENERIFEKYKKMIENFKAYYTTQGFPVYENPSPGNKKGGITTLEEKSLGCIKKAGTSKIVDVLDYGERVQKKGLSALNAPGNDLIAATALAAAGCQIVLFTTGRGTPFSTFTPTMKIGTNNKISAFKSNWIDFNAYSMDENGLFDLLIKAANGEYICKSEDVREIAFYKTGVTL
jgi:altronate hydrolase